MTRSRPSARGPSASTEARVAGVPIRRADKVWWPDEGITKGDVARFYHGVASRIVPWTAGRPLVAERCPDGMSGSCFFQKNFPRGLPDDVPRTRIVAESTGRAVHYVVGGSEKTLLSLVELGCIAIHVMNSRVPSLERPDWLAFESRSELRELLRRCEGRASAAPDPRRAADPFVPEDVRRPRPPRPRAASAGRRPGRGPRLCPGGCQAHGRAGPRARDRRCEQARAWRPRLRRQSAQCLWSDDRRTLLGPAPPKGTGLDAARVGRSSAAARSCTLQPAHDRTPARRGRSVGPISGDGGRSSPSCRASGRAASTSFARRARP